MFFRGGDDAKLDAGIRPEQYVTPCAIRSKGQADANDAHAPLDPAGGDRAARVRGHVDRRVAKEVSSVILRLPR